MKTKSIILLLALLVNVPLVRGQSTAFTYQGRLAANGIPANGNYDLQFGMHGAASGGSAIAGPITVSSVPVNNGLFAVTLDFGAGVFIGSSRWLQIGVRTNGSVGGFTTLLPRQAITSTPYAIQAAGLSGTLPDAQLSANIARLNASNFFSGPVNFNPTTGAPFSVSNTKKVANLNADKLDGLDSTNFVNRGGDSMYGPLSLPPNGLTVGNNQLVLAGSNVGVGTTSPSAALEVANPSGSLLRLNRNDGTGFFGLAISSVMSGSSADFFVTPGQANSGVVLRSTDSGGAQINALGIDRNGNVGIGTTSPGEKLGKR